MTNEPLIGKAHRTTALVAALVALTLGACSGGMLPLATAGNQKVQVLGDSFIVKQNGNTAVVKNYATGTDNQQRLLFNAQMAAIRATGCAIHTISQRPGVNTYDVTLTCPTPS